MEITAEDQIKICHDLISNFIIAYKEIVNNIPEEDFRKWVDASIDKSNEIVKLIGGDDLCNVFSNLLQKEIQDLLKENISEHENEE